MAYLSDPKETIAVLQRYRFNFQKKFGQNFLIDRNALDAILAKARTAAAGDEAVLKRIKRLQERSKEQTFDRQHPFDGFTSNI